MNGGAEMQVVTYLHTRFHKLVSGAHLAKLADLEGAIDKALTQVRRAIASGMETSEGGSARSRLEQLERELTAQRAYALEHGSVDRKSLQSTIRGVVEWVPDDELTLVAALGAVARAAPPGLS
jgi:hypothetical protein